MRRYDSGDWLPSGFQVGARVVMRAEERRTNGGQFGPPYEGEVVGGDFVDRVKVRRDGQRGAYLWHVDFWGDAP